MDPIRTVGATERARDPGQPAGQMDRRSVTTILSAPPPQQLCCVCVCVCVCVGGGGGGYNYTKMAVYVFNMQFFGA